MIGYKKLGPEALPELRFRRENAYREYHELDMQIQGIESEMSRQRQEQINQFLKEREEDQKGKL